jgi:hypothetical protein
MIANFFDPIAGLNFVTSQIWMGKNRSNKIKIPNAARWVTDEKNNPIPKINSRLPVT